MPVDREAWLKAIDEAPTAAVADLLRTKMAKAEQDAQPALSGTENDNA